ncbi:MAG: (d)CMP kinase [Succinivibrio sp.]|uniref:Cytidylate kinase n=1 Tax=Succinivibrio faecicola TaxID=2820300 RepID=A0ABS7DDQ3_9GAMM|nr:MULTISPECIES: (d)CMP kinase [Succinivibrio]MBW7569437.1 (d)CMP kinase [Succinivibrio faecicola]MDD6205257.1 (d)CMP kinase [Succinivibrio sp.]
MAEAIVIAVDGPSGVGKGELTKRLASALDYELLDSGAIYRVLGYAVRKAGLALFDEESVVQEAKLLNLSFECLDDGVHVLLNGEDVSSEIRTEEAGNNASKVAAYPSVRMALLQRQREFLKEPGLIADGRDMGTVVFPKANVKLFLDASAEVRANRRMLQLQQKGKEADYQKVLAEIKERDDRDRNRPVAPLKPADDALVIDTSDMTIEEVYKTACDYIFKKTGIRI